MRHIGMTAFWLSLAALVGSLAVAGPVGAKLGLQDATPGAAPPAATPLVIEEGALTLVAWYRLDASQDFLEVIPIETGDDLVASAGPVPAGQQAGRADFPEDGALPTIQLGETTFEAYSLIPDEPGAAYRWLWFNDTEQERPATLVLQVTATGGAYDGYEGTATFASRGENAGGVLVLMIAPPGAEVEATAAAEG